MEQTQYNMRSRAASADPNENVTLADKYRSFLDLAPGVQDLMGDKAVLERVHDVPGAPGEAPLARSASDFSYSADRYAGDGWRVVGDAGGQFPSSNRNFG